jgi:hypothetical protein
MIAPSSDHIDADLPHRAYGLRVQAVCFPSCAYNLEFVASQRSKKASAIWVGQEFSVQRNNTRGLIAMVPPTCRTG